jgi:hypothetical protein
MLILKPSPIAGVGVFTTIDIRKNATIEDGLFSDRIFQTEQVTGWKLHFSVWDPKRYGYWIPADYHRMQIGWYINNSTMPTCKTKVGWNLLAGRYIYAGEEITHNYELLT